MLTYHRDDLGTFGFRVIRGEDCASLHLEGELSMDTCPLLDRVLRDLTSRTPPRVDVDMRRVTYLGTHASLLLVAAQERARARGGRLAIRAAGPDVRDVVARLGLDA